MLSLSEAQRPIRLSPRQVELRDAMFSNKITIASGSIRSGKSAPAVCFFGVYAAAHFKDTNFGIGVRSKRQFDNVIMKLWKQWLGASLPLKRKSTWWEFGDGNRLHCFIGNDRSAVDKIRGFELGGVLVDEYPKQPEDFVAELFGRCNLPNSLFVMTANPEGPLHWAKTDWIDRIKDPKDKLQGSVISFALYDNPSLSQDFIDDIKSTYTGVMYKRLVEGLWTAATGAIYPYVEDVVRDRPKESAWRLEVAIDVASATTTHALLLGSFSRGKTWVIDEWRHDGSIEGQLKAESQIRSIIQRFSAKGRVDRWFVDPSANDFQLILDQYLAGLGAQPVIHGINDVIPGIQTVNMFMADGHLYIDPSCRHLIREMSNYTWDEKAAERGEDRPMKVDDHGPDALRYYCHTRSLMEARKIGFRRLVA